MHLRIILTLVFHTRMTSMHATILGMWSKLAFYAIYSLWMAVGGLVGCLAGSAPVMTLPTRIESTLHEHTHKSLSGLCVKLCICNADSTTSNGILSTLRHYPSPTQIPKCEIYVLGLFSCAGVETCDVTTDADVYG